MVVAPLVLMLAVVRPAQYLRVREVQLLEFVQILAGGGWFELYDLSALVGQLGEAVAGAVASIATGRRRRLPGDVPLAAGWGALRGGRCWRVDATVVDGHRVAVPLGRHMGWGGRGRARAGSIRIPGPVGRASLLAAAGEDPRRCWQSDWRIGPI